MKRKTRGFLVIHKSRTWSWKEVYITGTRQEADSTRTQRHEISITCVIQWDDGKKPPKRKKGRAKRAARVPRPFSLGPDRVVDGHNVP